MTPARRDTSRVESLYDGITRADILATSLPGAARELWLRWLIQQSPRHGTAWTRILGRRQNQCMPLDLTDLELETAARACRVLARQEEESAKRIENPTLRGPMENTARRAAALAEKFVLTITVFHSNTPSRHAG
jgi:hypothetical protein